MWLKTKHFNSEPCCRRLVVKMSSLSKIVASDSSRDALSAAINSKHSRARVRMDPLFSD